MRPRRVPGRVLVARRLADRHRDVAAGQVGERGRAQEPPVARGARPNPQGAVVVARRQMAGGVAGRVPAPDALAVQVAAIQAAAVPVEAVGRVAAPVEAVVGPLAMEVGMHLGAGQ